MDDIVTRLRNDECYGTHYEAGDGLGCTPCEAADEIERLRAELDSKDAVAYDELRRLYDNRGDELRNEIRNLERENRELEDACRSYRQARDRALRALEVAVRGE